MANGQANPLPLRTASTPDSWDSTPSFDIEGIQRRVSKLELLLLRTSVDKFQQLDVDVLKTLPRCERLVPSCLDHQPEI